MPGPLVVRRGTEPPDSFTSSIYLQEPRGGEAWFDDVLAALGKRGYSGVVFVERDDEPAAPSDSVAAWSNRWRRAADIVLVGADLGAGSSVFSLVRLGEMAESGRVVMAIGTGPGEESEELSRWAASHRIPVARTASEAAAKSLELMPPPALRRGAERLVPLELWHTPWFRGWYEAQTGAGHALRGIVDHWSFRRRFGDGNVLFTAWSPTMRDSFSDRVYEGEVVIGRPNLSALMLWWKRPDGFWFVLVKDYRPSATTPDGHVHELPSGSGDSDDPASAATQEFHEEVGLYIDRTRLRDHGSRQPFATMLGIQLHLFSAEGSRDEWEYVSRQGEEGLAHGVHAEGEYTYPTLGRLTKLEELPVDWVTVGLVEYVRRALRLPT